MGANELVLGGLVARGGVLVSNCFGAGRTSIWPSNIGLPSIPERRHCLPKGRSTRIRAVARVRISDCHSRLVAPRSLGNSNRLGEMGDGASDSSLFGVICRLYCGSRAVRRTVVGGADDVRI